MVNEFKNNSIQSRFLRAEAVARRQIKEQHETTKLQAPKTKFNKVTSENITKSKTKRDIIQDTTRRKYKLEDDNNWTFNGEKKRNKRNKQRKY